MTLINGIEMIKDCGACGLRANCTQVVVGSGPLDADIMIIGEAPGKFEDEMGIPFVGPAGQLLDRSLMSVGIDRSNIYITNIVKCRPPNNRKPTNREIITCSVNTDIIINTIDPILIVAAGQYASDYFLSSKGILYKKAVGRVFKIKDNRYIYVIRHPAYALHKHSPEIMDEVVTYIKKIPVIYNKIKDRRL